MKIKVLKALISVYGVVTPGMIITVPEHIGKDWIKNGIAVSMDEAPAGMFWCPKHNALHRLNSAGGKKCYKLVEAKVKAQAEAEVAALEAAEDARLVAEAAAAEEARVAEEAELAEEEVEEKEPPEFPEGNDGNEEEVEEAKARVRSDDETKLEEPEPDPE